jgi:hypothetical protein
VADQVIGDLAQMVGGEDGVAELVEGVEWTLVIASIRSSSRTGCVMRTGSAMRQP